MKSFAQYIEMKQEAFGDGLPGTYPAQASTQTAPTRPRPDVWSAQDDDFHSDQTYRALKWMNQNLATISRAAFDSTTIHQAIQAQLKQNIQGIRPEEIQQAMQYFFKTHQFQS